MKAPYYVESKDHADYLAGYEAEILRIYGSHPTIEDRLRARKH
jgi:hypothetical protein